MNKAIQMVVVLLFLQVIVSCNSKTENKTITSVKEKEILIDRVTHKNIDNKGVNIHYVTVGEGPVLLFVHGAPDFWYLWHNQIEALSDSYTCVAMDTRGYNESGKPTGMENYTMDFLMSDIDAVINDLGVPQVTLIAHDFGALISWNYVMQEEYAKKVNGFVPINLTHPRGFSRTLANMTPEQVAGTEYARILVDPKREDAAIKLIEGAIGLRMTTWWEKTSERELAFVKKANAQTSARSIVQYYQNNYFRQPYIEQTGFPQITVPVLQMHGLADLAVSKDGLSNTWDWVDAQYALITYPGVGHIPHMQVPDQVSVDLRKWIEKIGDSPK